MSSNPHEQKHAPDVKAGETVIRQPPIPQWKLATFLPLPFLMGCVVCLWHGYRMASSPVNTSDEDMAGFFIAGGVFAFVLYVVAVVLLGFFGHSLWRLAAMWAAMQLDREAKLRAAAHSRICPKEPKE